MDAGPRRRRGLALALLSLTLGLAGCVSDPVQDEAARQAPAGCSEDGWTAYEHPEAGYALCHPSDWLAREGLMGTDLAMIPPGEQGGDEFASNVNALHEPLPSQMSASEYLDAAIPGLERAFEGFQVVDRGSFEHAAGPGAWIVYEAEQGAWELRWHQWILTDDASAYLVTYTTEQAEDPVDDATLDRIVGSLAVTR